MNNVLIVGAGNMGEAMLKGWLKANNMLKQVYVREPDPSNWLKKVHNEKKNPSKSIKYNRKNRCWYFCCKTSSCRKSYFRYQNRPFKKIFCYKCNCWKRF